MMIFIGAVGSAITAALVWGIANAELLLQLLSYIAAGVTMVALIRSKWGEIEARPL
jgi:hypothetical protein